MSLISISALFISCGKTTVENFRELSGGIKGGGTYRTNELENIRSLDPVGINDVVSHHVAHQIYDNLFDLDSNLKLVPMLAESYKVSEDGTTYTFKIRQGVYFHDNKCFPDGKGREVTAEDVKYSFDRICDPRTGSKTFNYFVNYVVGAREYYDGISEALKNEQSPKLKGVSGYKAKGKYEFEIKLIQPFAPFIYYTTLASTYVVPKEAVVMYGQDFFQNPVGTGPFIFGDWKPDFELNLHRNPNYWMKDEHGNQLPYVDNIKFSFLKDNSQQLLEFKNGNLDECYRIPNEIFKEVVNENKELTPGWSQFVLQRVPTLAIQYYGMLVTSDLFKDKRVRQAINYAIDRDKIVRFVLNGQGYMGAVYGIVPPSMTNYDVEKIDGYEFNLQKAKDLMAEAGYPDGKGFPELSLQINAGGDRNIQIAEAIQAMLKEIGITMKLEIVQFAQHLDNIDAGKAPFYRLGWIGDYPDPENFLNLYYGKNVPADPNAISPINSTRYKNEKFDEIFEEALRTIDEKKRYELYQKAEQIAVSDAPMMYIYYDEDYLLLQPHVRGIKLDPMHRVNFRHLWLDK
ncbi:MAG: ABC transporter substrate-binding protein [Ignavibacteriales bacterium]|nr:ABC transporter substrate-binding protein [Ignavibacteria bacterium]MCC6886870.1 ABC transporter substrate-binding protein [Ignavibacteriales bacterium]